MPRSIAGAAAALVVVGLLAAAGVGLGAGSPFASGSSTATVSYPSDVTIEPDGVETAAVTASDVPAPGVCTVTVDVTYDPDIKIPTACEPDPDGHFGTTLCNIDIPGTISLTLVEVANPVSGGFPVANIIWQAAGDPGECTDVDVIVHQFADCMGVDMPVMDGDGENCIATASATVSYPSDAIIPAGGVETAAVTASDVPTPGVCTVTVDITYDQNVKIPTACEPDPDGHFGTTLCNKDIWGTISLTLVEVADPVSGEFPVANITWWPTGNVGQCTTVGVTVHQFADCSGLEIPVVEQDGQNCISCQDTDGDTICDDGDNSGTVGDNPCTGGETALCDDNCVNTPNGDQADDDVDGVGDVCDKCPTTYDPSNADNDGDGVPGTQPPPNANWGGDVCDADDDNDNMPDWYEELHACLDPFQRLGLLDDPDDDDLSSFGEMTLGTDPCVYDASHPNEGDGDEYNDGMEQFLGTDRLDDCPDDLSHDAWPPDLNGGTGCDTHDGQINLLDILCFRPVILCCSYEACYDGRFDLNADGCIDLLDLLRYRLVINTQCTNP